MANTLLTPVAQKKQPRRPTTWAVKVYQKMQGEAKLVHKSSITAYTRDAADKTRVAVAAQGYSARKLGFGPNATIIVEAIPITPVRLVSRDATPTRQPKLRVTHKRPLPEVI